MTLELSQPIKDWKNHAAYDYLNEQCPAAQWHWEFVRRHPDYQKEWDDLFQKYLKHPKRSKSNPYAFMQDEDLSPDNVSFALIDPKDRNHVMNQWGFLFYCSYENDQPYFLSVDKFLPLLVGKGHPFKEYLPNANDKLRKGEFAAIIDIYGDIESQLDILKREVLKLRKKIPEIFPKNEHKNARSWKLYLRMLDAIAAGKSNRKKDAEEFFEHIHYSRGTGKPEGWSEIRREALNMLKDLPLKLRVQTSSKSYSMG